MNTKRICQSCQAELPTDAPSVLCDRCVAAAKTLQVHSADVFGFTPPGPVALREHFPQLEVLELLGRGGMGAVYKARQRGLDRLVALKILPPELSVDSSFPERFAREARALARLNHPNVVSVFDLGKSGPFYYFLMEFVDGVDLRRLLERGRVAPRDALGLMQQICDGIDYAHSAGVIHRDIKPDNILLDGEGRVKIADFGIARILAASRSAPLTQSGHVVGTMHYMAPEQLEKPLEADHRADIYSLGVVLYQMLTGELPVGRFDLPSHKAAVDPRIDQLLIRALESAPGRRYQRVADMRSELEAIAGMASRLTPEVSRKLSYEYRSKAALFGLPLLHVATGVDPRTGRKRSARGIIAVGTAPRGIIAFGDVAVGVIACGIFGYGLVSVSVVSIGVVACGSIAVGLAMAMGGMAVAPVALGGAALGWFANGALAWGMHPVSPYFQDPAAERLFNPRTAKLTYSIFKTMLFAAPVFLCLGFMPALMAKASERRMRRRLRGEN